MQELVVHPAKRGAASGGARGAEDQANKKKKRGRCKKDLGIDLGRDCIINKMCVVCTGNAGQIAPYQSLLLPLRPEQFSALSCCNGPLKNWLACRSVRCQATLVYSVVGFGLEQPPWRGITGKAPAQQSFQCRIWSFSWSGFWSSLSPSYRPIMVMSHPLGHSGIPCVPHFRCLSTNPSRSTGRVGE